MPKYYDWCVKEGYSVSAILYVTLCGLKNAPPVKEEMKTLLRNVAMFSNKKSDIVNGWVKPCIQKSKTNDSSSLLRQYCKLLIYLGFDSMEKKVMDDFYLIANEKEFLGKVKKVYDLICKIPEYRADKLQASIENYEPFNKVHRYQPNYICFESYYENDNTYKLDIEFQDDGSACIRLWNPQRQDDEGNLALVNKIKEISYQDKMIQNGKWFSKSFKITEYKNMELIDKAIVDFTKELMIALKNSIKNE